MKELNEIMNDIKFGSVLLIDNNNSNDKKAYNSYIKEYDGDIFLDVKTVNLGNLLEHLINIKQLLDEGYTYQLLYDFIEKRYQSTIYKGKPNNKKKINLGEYAITFQTLSENFLDSIIELDNQIANSNILNQGEKKKTLALVS